MTPGTGTAATGGVAGSHRCEWEHNLREQRLYARRAVLLAGASDAFQTEVLSVRSERPAQQPPAVSLEVPAANASAHSRGIIGCRHFELQIVLLLARTLELRSYPSGRSNRNSCDWRYRKSPLRMGAHSLEGSAAEGITKGSAHSRGISGFRPLGVS